MPASAMLLRPGGICCAARDVQDGCTGPKFVSLMRHVSFEIDIKYSIRLQPCFAHARHRYFVSHL